MISLSLNFFLKNCVVFLMLCIMILGLTVEVSFFFWFLIEIQTFFFVIYFNLNGLKENSRLKKLVLNYFLVQCLSSTILLFIINSNSNDLNFEWPLIFIFLIKLGIHPFYSWYLNFMKESSWMENFFLFTVPKFIVFLMLSSLTCADKMVMVFMFTMFLSVIGGFKNSDFKIVFGFSSIFNTSFMGVLVLSNIPIFMIYFIIYALLMFVTFFNLCTYRLYSYSDFLSNYPAPEPGRLCLLILFFSILSLAGLPPLAMFIIKWGGFISIFKGNFFIFAILALTQAVLFIFYYLRLLFNLILTAPSMKNSFKVTPPKNFNFKLVFYLVFVLGLAFSIIIMLL